MKNFRQSLSLFAVIFIALITIVAFSSMGDTSEAKIVNISYSDVLNKIENDEVESIEIRPSTELDDYGIAQVKLKDGNMTTINIPSRSEFMGVVNQAIQDNELKLITSDAPKTGILMTILPSILMMVIAVVIFSVLFQKMQGGGGGKMMSFGKSKARVTLDEKIR